MLDVRTDYFLPLALRRLTRGVPEDIKETIELLILYRQLYSLPKLTRLEVVAHILPLLKSDDHVVRYWAARAIGEYECIEGVQPLREALAVERNLSVRGWLQGALAHLLGAQLEDVLKDLQSPFPETRALATQALFFERSPHAREVLAQHVDDSDLAVLPWKLLAIPGPLHMLQRIGLVWKPDPKLVRANIERFSLLYQKRVRELLKSLLNSGDNQATEFAIWNLSLGRVADALEMIPEIVRPSRHLNPSVREWGYKYLGFVPQRQSLPVLLSALKVETDPEAREGIAFAIGNIGGPGAIELLAEMLVSEADEGVRKWAARALGHLEASWRDAEPVLLNALETEKSSRVIREIYAVLQVKGAPALLSKLPLLETHAAPEAYQNEIIELLVALASKKMSFAAKDRLLGLLPRVPTEQSDLLELAYLLTEEYDLLNRLFPVGSHPLESLTSYKQGLNLLFQAIASYKNDPLSAEEDIRQAQVLLRSFRTQLLSEQTEHKFPVAAYAQFYEDLSTAYLQIAEGIESRLMDKLDLSTIKFVQAANFFELHAQDSALPSSERNLCLALKLWLDIQSAINSITKSAGSDKQSEAKILQTLKAAAFRAQDALRSSIVTQLDNIQQFLISVFDSGQYALVYDRHIILNKWLLAVPITLEAPFDANSCVSVRLNQIAKTPKRVQLEVEVKLDQSLLSQIQQPFDLTLIYFSRFGERFLDLHLVSSSEMSEWGKTQIRHLILERISAPINASKIELQPVLRFQNFEWITGTPIEVPVWGGDAHELLLMPSDSELRNMIVERFDLEEVRSLCQDLGVDFDSLPGEGKAAKIRELVSYMRRCSRIDQLVASIYNARKL